MHPGNLGAAVVTIMMEISPDEEKPHNAHLQVALNAWKDLYKERNAECKKKRRTKGLRTPGWNEGHDDKDDDDDDVDTITDQIMKELAEIGANETNVFRRRAATKWEVINDDPRDPYTSPGYWDPYMWGSIINT